MKTISLPSLVVALTLSACAAKRELPPAPASSSGALEFGEAEGDAARAAALQRDLAAAAGNDRVFFDLDSSTLSAEAKQTLTRHAEWLRARPSLGFTIEGHCDERGTREYNLALGERRANAVASYLAALGLAPDRMRSISYGKERPEALGSDWAAHAQNRRAVSVVVTG